MACSVERLLGSRYEAYAEIQYSAMGGLLPLWLLTMFLTLRLSSTQN